MSTITIPRRPAVSNYPDEKAFADELARAQQFYEAELTSSDGWEFAGERDGVRLDKKMDPSDAYAVPTVRGTCIVENATTEQVLSVIQQPGMRLIWDPRFESGAMLKRYTRTSYQFYSVMKGLGWLIWPRSIVGIQHNIRSNALNQEINVIQTSVDDPEYANEYGKVRAKVTAAGWRIKPVDNDVELSYLVKISLEGSIPAQIVQTLAVEIPTCAGRVRDAVYSHGFPPYVTVKDDREPTSIFQTESFDTEPVKMWKCSFTAKAGDSFSVLYDTSRMFLNGVTATTGIEGVVVKDDTVGKLDIEVTQEGDGKDCELIVYGTGTV